MKSFLNLFSPPLFLVLHGNNPTIWKKQIGVERRWELPRVPFLRVRPSTSVLGHGETGLIPVEADFSYGTEFGVVIGAEARRVPEREAWDYVAGYTCINDMYCHDYHSWYGDQLSPYENHARDTLAKAADGCGGIGPQLIPKEAVPDPYDLLTYTRENGRLKNRSYTGGYLHRIDYLIAYLSRFMTLPAGTVISMGAAGWDGVAADFPKRVGAAVDLEVEIESLGQMKNIVERRVPDRDVSPFQIVQKRRTANGLNAPLRWSSLWVLRGNYRSCGEEEGFPPPKAMCPHLFPALSMSSSAVPLVIPPHATTLALSCQLAAIVGSRPAYHVPREQAWEYLDSIALIVSLHDASLLEPVIRPTCYESRSAYFLGSCGDGFYKMSLPLLSHKMSNRLDRLVMTLQCGSQTVTTNTGDYLNSLADMLNLVSHETTLLPGDILSLGPAGGRLVIPENTGAVGLVKASLGNMIAVEFPLEDRRDQNQKDKEIR